MNINGLTTARWVLSQRTCRLLMGWFAAGAGLIGAVGFAVSFGSVASAAAPFLGWASWTLPFVIDVGIFVLSGLSLALELVGVRARLVRLIPHGLALYTVYLNTATQSTWFGKAVHAAGPLLWVTCVEIGAFTVRCFVGLAADNRMERVRCLVGCLPQSRRSGCGGVCGCGRSRITGMP
jgi:hypothetical protein